MILPNQARQIQNNSIVPMANGAGFQCTQAAGVNFHAGQQLGCNTDWQHGVGHGATMPVAMGNAMNNAQNLVAQSQPIAIRNACMQHLEWGNIHCH